MTRQGTAHFRNLDDAACYYAKQNFQRSDVNEKLRTGEIFLGPPSARPGQTVSIDEDGRCWLTEK